MKYIGGGWAGGGWEAEGGQHYPQGGKQPTETATVNLVGRDSRQQQLDTPSSSAHQWTHRPCSGPSWFYRVSKRPPVKADLAIYSLINGVSRVWLSC